MRGPKIRRFGTFSGGIDLPDTKGSALNEPISSWDRIKNISLPLGPNARSAGTAIVKEGQSVKAGDLIANAPNESPDVFAPTGATVSGLSTIEVAGRYAMRRTPCVELKLSSKVEIPTSISPQCKWRSISDAALWDRVTEGQITVHRPGSAPLSKWVLRARAKSCSLLIVNAMEQQPLVTANHRLLVDYGPQVLEGLAILGRATGITDMALIVPRRRTDAYRELSATSDKFNITQVALLHKYPTEADTILTKVLTRRSVPPGGTPMDVQVAVIDPATCFAAYRWVACGQRLGGRVVTVSDARDNSAGNYFIPFGTRCLDIVSPGDGIVVHGGPLIGLRCSDKTVVTPATDAVLSISPTPYTPSSPCIRCGWCTDHCPVRLNVASLNDDFELSLVKHAHRSGVTACVGCGVCSYICPARLPLMHRVRQLKLAAIHAAAIERKRSD
jgi:Na+-translocating ferredoxin:NAD+ oxidoreductase subunit C